MVRMLEREYFTQSFKSGSPPVALITPFPDKCIS